MGASANVTTYGDIGDRTAAFAAVQLLERGQELLVTERFGQAKPLPEKHSKTITFRRYESLLAATAPLAEGVSPAGQKLSATDVSAVLEQYGDVVYITDVIQDTHEDNTLRESVDLCGEQAAETIERIRITILTGGTNVFYANNAGSRAATGSVVARGDIRRVVRHFSRYKAQEISQLNAASAKVSTRPVAPAFFAMCHTDLESDIRGLPGFIPWQEYSNSGDAIPGEIGACERVRFILSRLFSSYAAAATSVSSTAFLVNGDIPSAAGNPDVYPIIIVAKNAYGIVPLAGKNAVTPMVVNPKPQIGDMLAQKGGVSWKTYQTACILNTNWLARLEVVCTAQPN